MTVRRAHITERLKRYSLPLGAVFAIVLFSIFSQNADERVSAVTVEAPPPPNPFEDVILLARAAYVLDAKKGTALFSKEGDAQLPLASLTKVMTAVTALSLVPDYTTITIDPLFLEPEGDTGLLVDERWNLKQLLGLTLITSSNDGARAIASAAGAFKKGTDDYNRGREAFIARMNEHARELGLHTTFFLNESGLDESLNISGGYGSARDIAHLFAHAITTYPEVFAKTTKKHAEIASLNNILHGVGNTNKKVHAIPRLLGSKTGFTDLAGGNLVIAFDAGFNRPIIVSVLGSTQDGRFTDAEALVWAALSHLDNEVSR